MGLEVGGLEDNS